MIAELIGWAATVFRGAGMLAKNADMVKYLVSIDIIFCHEVFDKFNCVIKYLI